MTHRNFIFLAGHHRSGTSLLHEIIREHPAVSGFTNTGAPEDEGQHLQSVYQPALKYGGPGKYIFNPDSYMDETDELATKKSAEAIFYQWKKYLNTDADYYIEKSPPNLIRSRFLQHLYPDSKFIVIFRHPLVVACATQKWSRTSIKSLVEHTLLGYELFINDLPHLEKVYTLRYEDFVNNPQRELDHIFAFLSLDSMLLPKVVTTNINDKYFTIWERSHKELITKIRFHLSTKLEQRARAFGYSLKNPRVLLPFTLSKNDLF